MANTMGIKQFDYVEFYVGSAKMVAYWFSKALGFGIKGYLGPETGIRDRTSYYLVKNNVKMVITSATQPATFDVNSFVTTHGDGIKRWSVLVQHVGKAYEHAITHHAISVQKPLKISDDNGYVEEAAVRIYDDTELCFINYDHYKGIFKPGYHPPSFSPAPRSEDSGLMAIDHIVGNVRENEMDRWATYFNQTMDFETYVHFGPGDIATPYSSLLSKVVRTKDNAIKVPINEPYQGRMKSQIEEYLEEYRGSGIQHIAISTNDIVSSIRTLKKNGVEFLSVPSPYYDALRRKNIQIDENINELEACGILCDTTEEQGYLLQLFTKPIGDRPTFFFEIIQRKKGAQGFGHGNFQALFEAIEAEQQRRGNLRISNPVSTTGTPP